MEPQFHNNQSVKIISSVGPSQLKFTRVNNLFVASWPGDVGAYLLESTPSLSPPINWVPVVLPVISSGGQNIVSNNLTGASIFFRLRAP